MKLQNLLVGGGALAAAVVLSVATPVQAATTVVVSGDTSAGENQPGWMFNRDASTDTPFEFNTDQASIGEGSLYVQPIGSNPSDKFVAENFLATPVDEVSSIAFDYLIAGNGDVDDSEQFYLNVYANIDDSTNYYDCRFDYVASGGSTANFTTFEVNTSDVPTEVTKRGTNIDECPATLAEMPEGSYIRAFAINVGDTSANDEGLAGYLDNVVVNTTADETIYDFEVVNEPTLKDFCKKGGFEGLTDALGKSFRNQGQCVSYFNRSN